MKSIKRSVSLLLTAVMALSLITAGCAAEDRVRFDDVPADTWYTEAVEYCRENGLIDGISAAQFGPNGDATRAVLTTALYRQAGEPAVTGTDSFADTAENAWYSNAVLWAAQKGIVNGYGNGCFGTDDPVTREQRDPAARPAITGTVANMEQYDVIFLGYPIWHGQAPKIIYTFVETYDLTGKTVVPFCTSGSSGMGSSAANLAAVTSGADWLEGRRFSGSTSQSAVGDWVNGLDLPKTAPDHNEEEANKVYLQISGAQNALWTATLAENSSAQALKELLGNGPLTIEMHDYSNFEKVGPIGQNLPTNDERITTAAGDIILYQGSSLVIYYDTNSWSFTRLGRVDNVTQAEMKEVLGAGDVTAILSLTAPGS